MRNKNRKDYKQVGLYSRLSINRDIKYTLKSYKALSHTEGKKAKNFEVVYQQDQQQPLADASAGGGFCLKMFFFPLAEPSANRLGVSKICIYKFSLSSTFSSFNKNVS